MFPGRGIGMVAMYTARTSEIDEINEAVGEIKSQIDLGSLKKHSGGIIFCHNDYVLSGVVAALCEELPFPVIGMTSMVAADKNGYGLYDLMLTVLTSDEVSFEAGMTNAITPDNYADEVDILYKDMRSRVSEDPTMIFTFMPLNRDVSGYEVVAAMDKTCGGIPFWGSVTNNLDSNYETVQTICNGQNLRDGIVMLFFNGPVTPTFIVSSLPERNISNNRAVITKSKGAVIYEVNNMPTEEFLKNVGLILTKENLITTPLMIYYGDAAEPVALGVYTLFEDGSVLTGGDMPEGTSIAVGTIDKEGIYESTKDGLRRILDIPNRNGAVLLPCVTRYIMLSPDLDGELKMVCDTLANGVPFVMGYSGGEICPMPGADGKLVNRFHNYTFCACAL